MTDDAQPLQWAAFHAQTWIAYAASLDSEPFLMIYTSLPGERDTMSLIVKGLNMVAGQVTRNPPITITEDAPGRIRINLGGKLTVPLQVRRQWSALARDLGRVNVLVAAEPFQSGSTDLDLLEYLADNAATIAYGDVPFTSTHSKDSA